MSIQSRQRNKKRPTPESGRLRKYGKVTRPAPLNLTALQHDMHTANKANPIRKTRGAFGGVTRASRFAKKQTTTSTQTTHA